MASQKVEIGETSGKKPVIIGITGGIGSGKSVVSRILRLNGYRVYDCDSEAKRLMEHDAEVIMALTALLGKETYQQDERGEDIRLNRSYVASRIFTDDRLRTEVNSVMHKAVSEDFMRFAHETEGTVFCETAILATSHMDALCDRIWIVTAPEEERIERVKARNGLSEHEIRQRIESQADEFSQLPEDKILIIMNGDRDMLLPQIFKELKRYA